MLKKKETKSQERARLTAERKNKFDESVDSAIREHSDYVASRQLRLLNAFFEPITDRAFINKWDVADELGFGFKHPLRRHGEMIVCRQLVLEGIVKHTPIPHYLLRSLDAGRLVFFQIMDRRKAVKKIAELAERLSSLEGLKHAR